MYQPLWLAIALTAVLAASNSLAAPGGGGPGHSGAGPKGASAQQSQDKLRTETKAREREMKGAPDQGERRTNREEVNERTRAMEDGDRGKGAETSQEMQQRRDERKQIQQEYKEGRKSGEVEKAQKKPWWKFWGEEEAG